MGDNKVSTSGGIGFVGMLTILFIGLKLGKIIDWSWWWVLSPLWISSGIGLITLVCLGLVFLTIWAFKK